MGVNGQVVPQVVNRISQPANIDQANIAYIPVRVIIQLYGASQ